MLEDATMPRVKQASKKKRVTKAAVPALGAAGLTFSVAGSALAAAVPTADVQRQNFAPGMMITLGEEEISDVSLATFQLFDDEENALSGVQLARGCGGCRGCGGGCAARGCGGFRGCGGCRGCAGCRACRCGVGCGGGCGVGWVGVGVPWVATGCCASWGRCRWC
jgi:hypothetical protein